MSDTYIESTEAEIEAHFEVRSHLNAVRSQLTGQVTVMDREDRIRHDHFVHGIVVCLKPANALELQLAQSIAEDYWRLNRVRGIEEGIFSLAHPDPAGDVAGMTMEHEIALSQTRTFIWKQEDFKFLSQYEMRIQRSLDRTKAELKQLQASRPKKGPEDNDGFVFSNQPPAAQPEPPKARTATANGFAFSNAASTAATPVAAKPATAAAPAAAPVAEQPAAGFVFSESAPHRDITPAAGVSVPKGVSVVAEEGVEPSR